MATVNRQFDRVAVDGLHGPNQPQWTAQTRGLKDKFFQYYVGFRCVLSGKHDYLIPVMLVLCAEIEIQELTELHPVSVKIKNALGKYIPSSPTPR